MRTELDPAGSLAIESRKREADMRRWLIVCLGAAIFAAASLIFALDSRVSQSLVLKVSSFGVLGVSGNPPPLLIEPRGESADDSTELRYTSAVGRGGRRVIVAQWEIGNAAPSGCTLRLTAHPARTGPEGSSAGEIFLSEGPQLLIAGIGSCAAGLRAGEGAKLTYRLYAENPALWASGEAKRVTVLFTLMDAF
jgi:hypothetical protein